MREWNDEDLKKCTNKYVQEAYDRLKKFIVKNSDSNKYT